MKTLNSKQLEFLKNEFGITKIDYSNKKEVEEIRLKCFDIETDECYDRHMAGEDTSSSIGERGDIAVSIIDALYDIIHTVK
ncbi:MAG: hypothetical protein GXY08_01705 [Ruminococcus sp.]|nr:hypothetical protein [Ruminococcus sp.]